jgi:hypothetical protein
MEDKKIKFEIDNGQSFFADEIGIIHNPLKIMFDFKSITPRVDIRNQEFQPLVLRHNVVMMDPHTAKTFLEILKKNLDDYEKQYGKIEMPKQLKKMNKKKPVQSEKMPTYLG